MTLVSRNREKVRVLTLVEKEGACVMCEGPGFSSERRGYLQTAKDASVELDETNGKKRTGRLGGNGGGGVPLGHCAHVSSSSQTYLLWGRKGNKYLQKTRSWGQIRVSGTEISINEGVPVLNEIPRIMGSHHVRSNLEQ